MNKYDPPWSQLRHWPRSIQNRLQSSQKLNMLCTITELMFGNHRSYFSWGIPPYYRSAFGYSVVTNGKRKSFVDPKFKPTKDSSERTRNVYNTFQFYQFEF